MMPRRRWLRRVRCALVAGWQLAAMNEALGITTLLLPAEPRLARTKDAAEPWRPASWAGGIITVWQ
jgi:hypothetical protein